MNDTESGVSLDPEIEKSGIDTGESSLEQPIDPRQEKIAQLLSELDEVTVDEGVGRFEKNFKVKELLGEIKRVANGESAEHILSEDEAQGILGKDFIGSQKVREVLEIEGKMETPPLKLEDGTGITTEMLEWAKEHNMALILRYPQDGDGKELTVENLNRLKHKKSLPTIPEISFLPYNVFEEKVKYKISSAHWAIISKQPLVTPDLQPPNDQLSAHFDNQIGALETFSSDFAKQFALPERDLKDFVRRNPAESAYDYIIYNTLLKPKNHWDYQMLPGVAELIEWEFGPELNVIFSALYSEKDQYSQEPKLLYSTENKLLDRGYKESYHGETLYPAFYPQIK